MTMGNAHNIDLVMDVQVEETPALAAERKRQEEKAKQGGQQ